jgi:hypothetical protein
MKMKRYLKEEDAEKLWDFGGTLQGLAYREELSRGDSAWLGAIGRELRLIVARSGGQPKTRQEVEGK